MSIYAVNDNKKALQVATNTGYGQYGRWAEGLPNKENFREVMFIWTDGLTNHAPQLIEQLHEAQKVHEPDADVKGVIKGILRVCEGAQHVMMTNGLAAGRQLLSDKEEEAVDGNG
jgi:hypothetical protein